MEKAHFNNTITVYLPQCWTPWMYNAYFYSTLYTTPHLEEI